jgi:threonyl-tRNA synthetase
MAVSYHPAGLQLPQRFELKYADADGSLKTPVVIHRAILGSLERFWASSWNITVVPSVWLSPVQIQIATVVYIKSAHKLAQPRRRLRVAVDEANETVGNKIRAWRKSSLYARHRR